MNKKLLMVGIFIWVIVAVSLTGILIIGISGKISFAEHSASLIKEKDVSTEGISNIIVEDDSAAIEVLSTTESEMKVRQYGRANTEERDLFTVEVDGESVKIKLKQKLKIFGFDFLNKKLLIEIPETWIGDMKIKSSSGRIRLKDSFIWENTELTCTSGGIRIDKPLNTENLTLKVSSGGIQTNGKIAVKDLLQVISTSGGIHLNESVEANEIYAKVSSGGMYLKKADVQSFNLLSTSGGIKVGGITGSGSAKVSSGGIKIKLDDPLGNVDLKSTSGQIKITLDPSLAFYFNGKCTSGGIRSDFPIHKNGNEATAEIGDDPKTTITAKSSSGGIRLINANE